MDCPECSGSLRLDYDSMERDYTEYHWYEYGVGECGEHGKFDVVKVRPSDPHSKELMWISEDAGECEWCGDDSVASVSTGWDRYQEVLCESCFYFPDEIIQKVL